MSLGKIAEGLGLGKLKDGVLVLSLEEFEKLMLAEFHKAFGRWESSSGRVFVVVCHHSEGNVVWQMGTETGLDEDTVLPIKEALPRFQKLVQGGFISVFPATTLEDVERETAKIDASKSLLARTFRVGTYRKGEHFLRVNEFQKGVYFLEYGRGMTARKQTPEATEAEALAEIRKYEAKGYVKEGRAPIRSAAETFMLDGANITVAEPDDEDEDGLQQLMESFYN
jgi:hypothetical protein